MGNQTFIEINGKRYDAVTGKLLNTTELKPTETEVIKPAENVRAVDGFSKRPSAKVTRVAGISAKKTPQKSNTLMRRSVKKPDVLSSKSKSDRTPHGTLKKKLGESPVRAQRANEVHRSPQIQKFEHPKSRSSVIKRHEALPVKQLPVISQVTTHAQSQPLTHPSHQQKVRSVAAEKLIEAALTNADSHNEQPVHHKRKRKSRLAKKLGISTKAAAMSSAVLAMVILAGFFAIQNVPNIAMKVAATRAGFDAEMPGYQPSGFSFKGPINYSTGKVTVSFQSNIDDRKYDFTQSNSNWSSDALLSNYIVAEGKQYQTYLDRGRTLYIYDGSNATWVDNGVWYQIEGNSGMTTDQLIRIASSI